MKYVVVGECVLACSSAQGRLKVYQQGELVPLGEELELSVEEAKAMPGLEQKRAPSTLRKE